MPTPAKMSDAATAKPRAPRARHSTGHRALAAARAARVGRIASSLTVAAQALLRATIRTTRHAAPAARTTTARPRRLARVRRARRSFEFRPPHRNTQKKKNHEFRCNLRLALGNVGRRRAGSVSDRYKTELCRSWEETRACRYGAKCQVRSPAVLFGRPTLTTARSLRTAWPSCASCRDIQSTRPSCAKTITRAATARTRFAGKR